MKKSDKPELSAYFFYLILFGLVISLLAGCTTPSPRLRTLPADYVLGDKEESLIFGRISTPKGTFGLTDKLNTAQLLVKNEISGEVFTIVCDAGGADSYFFIALPPGAYTAKKVKRGNGYSFPSLLFVAEPGKVNYLGTLKFVAEKEGQDLDAFGRFLGAIEEAFKKGLTGKSEKSRPEDWHMEYDSTNERMEVRHSESFIKGGWNVEDGYDEAAKVFQQRYPHIDKEIRKNFFRKEDGA